MADKYIRHGATYNGDGTSSAAANGSTATITIASPGVVTWNSHGLTANAPVYFGTTGALPTGLTAGTKYFVRNPTTNTFEVSATAGGASINTSGTQSGTHTATTAGAWNHINIMEGTAVNQLVGKTEGGGSIAAGDVIYIRSKDNGGADITVTLASNTTLGSSSATEANPIRWVLDGGTVWSGINGVLTYKRTGAEYSLSFQTDNIFVGENVDKWVVADEYASANTGSWVIQKYRSHVEKLFFDNDNVTFTSNGPRPYVLGDNNSGATMVNCHMALPNKWWIGAIQCADYSTSYIVGLDIEMPTLFTTAIISLGSAFPAQLHLYGGQLRGAGATTGAILAVQASNAASRIQGVGFAYPQTVKPFADQTVAGPEFRVDMLGLDSGLGAVHAGRGSLVDSRNDGNYPTLNATYPNSSNTGWSFKVHPINVGRLNPIDLSVGKVYAESAGTKTVTMEFLINNGFSGANKGNLWMDVIYIDDSSGQPKFVSTRDWANGALDSSTASWSSTTYGALSLNKRKFSVATPTSVKQDTMIVAVLRGNVKSVSGNDILFVCPDIQLT